MSSDEDGYASSDTGEEIVRMNAPNQLSITFTAFGNEIVLDQNPASGFHNSVLWDAAIAMIRYVETNPTFKDSLYGKRVLELGSGTGALGIALAHCGADVVLTDLAIGTELLQANVNKNRAPMMDSNGAGRMRVAPYHWGDPIDTIMEFGPFDYIFGTDVAYSEISNPVLLESAALIAKASDKIFSSSQGDVSSDQRRKKCRIYFANELRCVVSQEVFDTHARKHFFVKPIPKKSLPEYCNQTNMLFFEMKARK